jgi:cytochrome c-type biogenesis protein CcmH/NrfG
VLSAQANPEHNLAAAFALEQDGRTADAIAALHALLDYHVLNESGQGKAWNILGLAYEDQGNFARAQWAYEQSIHVLRR